MDVSNESLPPATPDMYCRIHGRTLHGLIHEAGHAVVACLFGISFNCVSIPRDLGPADSHFGAHVGGGLDMGRLPETWVVDDPSRALEMLMAGRAAEMLILGHDLPDSYRGDATVWGWGMRAHADVADGGGQAAAMTALGEPPDVIVDRAAELVKEYAHRVLVVANAIHDSETRTLTSAEVVALL